MPLIVHSKSTEEFAKSMRGEFLCISKPPTRETLKIKAIDDDIRAIGGGSVIDTAKILATNSKKKTLLAMPTTASGAARTSHAVYWHGKHKYSMKTLLPITKIIPSFFQDLPKDVIRATSYDALSQAMESYWSRKATNTSRSLAEIAVNMIIDQINNDYPNIENLIKAGNLSGEAIEITGTNITHAISYPLTAFYDIPHGLAVGLVLPAVARFMECKFEVPEYKINIKRDFDIELIAREAMIYPQIFDAVKDVTKEQMIKILEESL